MSDSAQGPGWWLASDGRWYPPELWTGPVPNVPTSTIPPGPTASVQAPTYNRYGYSPQAGYIVAVPNKGTNGIAIASLVCACAGILLLGLPSIVGIVLGFVARTKIRQSNGTQGGSGLALAGIIVGFVVVGLVVLGIVVNATHSRTGQ
jgi:hypothetical protein